MPKTTSTSSKSDQSCLDIVQTEQSLLKVARSTARSQARNERIRKSVKASLASSEDEYVESSQSDLDLHDDEEFVPETNSEDDEFKIKRPLQKPSKKKAPPKKTNFVTVSDSILNLRECVKEMRESPNPLFEILPNLDPNLVNSDSNPVYTAEHFQNNTSAIHMLNEINAAKQSARNSFGKGAPVDVMAPHYAELESALKNVDPLFHAPKQGTMPSCSSSEMNLSSISETLIDSRDKSIENNGPTLIKEIPKIPVRLREQEEQFMREPFPHERSCISSARCEGNFIGSSSQIDGFTLVEYPSEDALAFFNLHKKWPEEPPNRCVLCERKAMNDLYLAFLAGNFYRSSENPMRFLGQIKYHNKVGPGEYSYCDVFTTSQNALDGSVLPIVWNLRAIYQRETRITNYGEKKDFQIRCYRQILTDPSSFRDGRTEQQSSSSMNTQH